MSAYNRRTQIKSTASLPAPRLQLRWEPGPTPSQWACIYELVIPLRNGDVRCGGPRSATPNQARISMIRKCIRGSSKEPCIGPDGGRYADEPYRDGCHAQWDAEALGGLPVYVIALDGEAFLVDKYRGRASED